MESPRAAAALLRMNYCDMNSEQMSREEAEQNDSVFAAETEDSQNGKPCMPRKMNTAVFELSGKPLVLRT